MCNIARSQWWRLKCLDVPYHVSHQMMLDIEKWEQHSGVTWTINRLKGIKLDLIRHRNNQEPLTHLRKNKKGGIYGWIGSIFRFSEKSERSFAHAIQALMSYTLFISNRVTDQQWEKFHSGVTADPTFIPEGLKDEVKVSAEEFYRYVQLWQSPIKLYNYEGSPSKRAPVANQSSVPQSEKIELEVTNLRSSPKLVAKYGWFYKPIFEGFNALWRDAYSPASRLDIADYTNIDCSDEVVGNIGFIQEPGYKLRSVASPYRVHQLALKPLGDSLFNILRECPWDCTHDQSKAIPHIQEALRQGRTVHCVDLSSATDYFPLELQLEVLRTVFGNSKSIKLFEDLSRAKWKVTNTDGETDYISWTRGQPMGLYPSFAAFGLTHGLLLYTLSNRFFRNQFFVVGDDVVIIDDLLSSSYQQTLKLLECPYSPDKTISSSVLAEFAGKIITKDSVIPQLKWRKVSDDNFIDILRLLGQRASKILTPRQRAVYKVISRFLPPIGLNHSNGPGQPLETTSFLTEEFISLWKKDSPKLSIVDLLQDITRRFRANPKVWNKISSFDSIASTFDEKVAKAFNSTVFTKLIKDSPASAKMFRDLPQVMEDSSLPLELRPPSRETTLEVYERKLHSNTRD